MTFLKSPLMLIIIVIVVAVFGFVYHDNLVNIFHSSTSSDYQAVFLANGQVYFGKISGSSEEYVDLKDVFYLQAGKQLQSGDVASSSASQLSLVKLGNELHGPTDAMHINRDQILFFEDLKTNGRVVQAILEYNKGNEPASKN